MLLMNSIPAGRGSWLSWLAIFKKMDKYVGAEKNFSCRNMTISIWKLKSVCFFWVGAVSVYGWDQLSCNTLLLMHYSSLGTNTTITEASKCRLLPVWIREGLEKMEWVVIFSHLACWCIVEASKHRLLAACLDQGRLGEDGVVGYWLFFTPCLLMHYIGVQTQASACLDLGRLGEDGVVGYWLFSSPCFLMHYRGIKVQALACLDQAGLADGGYVNALLWMHYRGIKVQVSACLDQRGLGVTGYYWYLETNAFYRGSKA